MFTVVWPLAPLACLVISALEQRAAACRLCISCRRPVAHRCSAPPPHHHPPRRARRHPIEPARAAALAPTCCAALAPSSRGADPNKFVAELHTARLPRPCLLSTYLPLSSATPQHGQCLTFALTPKPSPLTSYPSRGIQTASAWATRGTASSSSSRGSRCPSTAA
eukprot:593575-Prymnesium_polylepis.1